MQDSYNQDKLIKIQLLRQLLQFRRFLTIFYQKGLDYMSGQSIGVHVNGNNAAH